MLVLIGLGLWDEKDISLRGLEEAKGCDQLYLEAYTSRLFGTSRKKIQDLIGKEVKTADRGLIESGGILEQGGKIGLLIPGDPMVATTHADLILRAREQGREVKVIHNASIHSAVAESGLQAYKFGRSVTIPYWEKNYRPTSFYDVIKGNKERGLHTLLFLDIKADKEVFMTPNDAIDELLAVEEERKEGIITTDTRIVVCSRMGGPGQSIVYGKAGELAEGEFGEPMHVIVVPGELHDIEKKFLEKL